jgi:hypothetical protein
MVSINKKSNQSKEKLYSQMSHEGLEPPKLLTLVNYDKGIFDMTILQLKVGNIEANIRAHEYETTKVKFDLDKMLIIDKIEWHKQIGNVVSRDLIHTTTNVKNLRGMTTKLENQLK